MNDDGKTKRQRTCRTWPDEVYQTLKQAGIRPTGIVPDAGRRRLIRSFEADPETSVVTLTTEEEGVRSAGRCVAGRPGAGVLLLQSSGVGENCINMLSLPVIYQHAAVDDRDHARRLGRVQPVADSDGAGHQGRTESIGVIVTRADEPHLVASAVQGAANLAFNTWRPTAVLIGQRVLGAKNFKELARK